MDMPAQLSMEQKFRLQVLQKQVKTLSREEAQDCLLEVLRQMMVKDNMVKHLLKNN
ncbi:MAG: NblA/ycf18 family protein [Cyanobacteriota bacterium]|nr:NblA/ycf18 family protein [Cyanobacteriota bacterium]